MTAIAGLVQDAWGYPVVGARVQIWERSVLRATVYTDEHGFYLWAYKYTGKPTTFTVKLPEFGMQITFAFKSNGIVVANFYLPSPDGSIPGRTEVFAKWL